MKGSTPTKAGTRPVPAEETTSYNKQQACVNSTPSSPQPPVNDFSYEKLMTMLENNAALDEIKRLVRGDAAERHGLSVGGMEAHSFPVLGGSTHLLEASAPCPTHGQ